MKKLGKVIIGIFICSVFYFISAYFLKDINIFYRNWVDVLVKVTDIFILPLLVTIWICEQFIMTYVRNSVVKKILKVVVVGLHLCFTFIGILVLIFTVDQEKKVTSNLLVTGYSEFLGESHYVYYRPFGPLLKVPWELTEEDKKEYLEKKYEREFEIDPSGNFVYCADFPNVNISVNSSGLELEDDFIQGVLEQCLSEGMEELSINRDYSIDQVGKMKGHLYIHLKDENDIHDFAIDTSKLISYIINKTSLFEDHLGYLGFYCGEGDDKIISLMPVGKFGKWEDLDLDYYLYPEKVEEYIREKYKKAVENQKQAEEYKKKCDENFKKSSEQKINSDQEVTSTEEVIDPIEIYAKKIYDEVLSEKGYSYEVCYDAKGNLYLNLGERPAGVEEDKFNTGTYCNTLVYDRTSKNGTCELYVLYQEHYIKEENGDIVNDATTIMDMYAIEVSTGKVVASGKQNWSDIGSKEYRELTGE